MKKFQLIRSVSLVVVIGIFVALVSQRITDQQIPKGFIKYQQVDKSLASDLTPAGALVSSSTGAVTLAGNTGVWQQDFASMPDGELNTNDWTYDIGNGGADNPGWGNNEVEYYTNSTANSSIQNGQLVIQAVKQSYDGYDYTSARVTTLNKESFLYGKLDVVARLPAGAGTWPAIWLLPVKDNYAINTSAGWQDPLNYLRDGEIDMVEAVGSYPGVISSSAQSYTYNPTNNNERVQTTTIPDYSTAFHDYSMDWTPTSLSFAVDGKIYHTVTKQPSDSTLVWPYNEPYYLILNIAMGGVSGGTDAAQYPPDGIDDASAPWQMFVKSISFTPYN